MGPPEGFVGWDLLAPPGILLSLTSAPARYVNLSICICFQLKTAIVALEDPQRCLQGVCFAVFEVFAASPQCNPLVFYSSFLSCGSESQNSIRFGVNSIAISDNSAFLNFLWQNSSCCGLPGLCAYPGLVSTRPDHANIAVFK